MRTRFHLSLAWPLWCILLAGVGSGCAQSEATGGSTVWRLDRADKVGGHITEVLGSPKVIASPFGPSIQFNGQTDGLILPVNPIGSWPEFTVEMLIKPDRGGPLEQRFLHVQDGGNSRGLLELRMYENGWAFDAFLFSGPSQLALFDRTKLHPADRWTWVAMTYRAGKLSSFVDGVKELEGEVNFPAMGPGTTSLGVRQNKISWFKGAIRDVRFHPTALPLSALQRPKGK